MIISPKTVLVLAPHTDDGEFGCGATLSKLSRQGAKIIYVAFSAPLQYSIKHLPADILKYEVQRATGTLGLSVDDCIILDYQVREFSAYRQAILDEMIKLNHVYKPDLIFLPSLNDTHQDHQTIANEGFRAFKRSTLLGYELPWNNLEFRTSCFFEISEYDLDIKIKAIAEYKSQSNRPYANPEFIKSLAMTRGVQIGKKFAEVFEVVRLVFE